MLGSIILLIFLTRYGDTNFNDILFITIFSIIVIGLIFTPTVLLNIYNTMSEEDEQYPVAAVKFINSNPSVKNIMLEYGDGGYLIFNFIRLIR